MLSASGLGVFLLLATSSAHTVIQSCLCSALLPAGLQVNCSSLNLMEVPRLPLETKELHLQDNQLTAVSPGVFDRLPELRRVHLSRNPFHCDCRIQYLRNWLLRNRDVISGEPTCVSPSSVAHTPITELKDDHFSSCAKQNCVGGGYNTLIGVMLCGLIVLLMWGLRLAKNSTYTLDIDERHTGFEAHSLRSLKPKHRRRLQGTPSEVSGSSASLTWTDDLERPLINMEILPQILDSLHKKHNIKIKAS
ncbi:platelet glycoprotein IX [Polymixia lowei]